MKRIFTTALLALLGTSAFAQTSQGTIAVSGSVSLRHEVSKALEDTSGGKNGYRGINLNPHVGYFVQNGLELGVGLGLSRSTNMYKWDDGKSYIRSNEISLRPYARKYVALTEQLQLHGTGYLSVGLGNRTSKGNEEGASAEVFATSYTYGIGFYPGLTYFATPKLGFTASFGALSYSRGKETPKDDRQYVYPTDSHSFAVDLSTSSVSIGIGYYLTR
ncbi:outer membrane beta-barrel protein [Pontibacter roseus]|uniref:outer membrane beta-barrel protein n=1 Tax=Pontibacter roseus TaxID=336989 RepID=UPI000377FA2D|nr:outer membrane beta-barrel protein [Pontibacter roseus]